jgi:hypothetical protein
VGLFFINIGSLILWIVRFGSYNQRYEFIKSRLTRATRPEVPRFRFDFKHAKRDLGDHVHSALVQAFVLEYLEPDGFFFIRILTVNVSDFVVQEIIEQLWTCYIMKYGENDAQKAEESFYAFRKQMSQSSSITPLRTSMLDVVDKESGATDSKRKYMKQYSDVGTGLLRSASAIEPVTTSTKEQQQPV